VRLRATRPSSKTNTRISLFTIYFAFREIIKTRKSVCGSFRDYFSKSSSRYYIFRSIVPSYRNNGVGFSREFDRRTRTLPIQSQLTACRVVLVRDVWIATFVVHIITTISARVVVALRLMSKRIHHAGYCKITNKTCRGRWQIRVVCCYFVSLY